MIWVFCVINEGMMVMTPKEVFLKPNTPAQRRYEALRARYVDGADCKTAAKAFGYSLAGFRNLCSAFMANPDWSFFQPQAKPPQTPTPAAETRRKRSRRILELRRTRNLSVHRIAEQMTAQGEPVSAVTVAKVIRSAGLPRLPRRSLAELDEILRPVAGETADRRTFRLGQERFRTRFGGLFAFAPMLAGIGFDRLVEEAGMPSTAMIPAGCAWRSLLALKLWGIGRPSQAMAEVLDPGLALFAGLNAFPKRSTLTEYTTRVDPRRLPELRRRWNGALRNQGLAEGGSFDLDFHTIPYHGDRALIEKHHVSRRSRRQNGILAFLASDAGNRTFLHCNATVRKDAQNEEVLRFVEEFRVQTGAFPGELVFDSGLTTHANLAELDRLGIRFLTLRRRSKGMMDQLRARPRSDWTGIRLANIGRRYRTPRIIDGSVRLRDCPAEFRQIAVADLGHDDPVLLLTNQFGVRAGELVDRYARRMVIENQIAEAIDFFHMDALSAAVPMRIDTDLQLTIIAGGLYRLFAGRIGNGYAKVRARTLFRDFIDAVATVDVSETGVCVRFSRRAHNPLMINAGFADGETPIPWLDNRSLRLEFP